MYVHILLYSTAIASADKQSIRNSYWLSRTSVYVMYIPYQLYIMYVHVCFTSLIQWTIKVQLCSVEQSEDICMFTSCCRRYIQREITSYRVTYTQNVRHVLTRKQMTHKRGVNFVSVTVRSRINHYSLTSSTYAKVIKLCRGSNEVATLVKWWMVKWRVVTGHRAYSRCHKIGQQLASTTGITIKRNPELIGSELFSARKHGRKRDKEVDGGHSRWLTMQLDAYPVVGKFTFNIFYSLTVDFCIARNKTASERRWA
jgi:hypothetical protein